MAFNYPKPRRDESKVDEKHGHKIKDPYRWMEDPESEETQNFIHEQNKITRKFIDQCTFKEKITNRLRELVDYPRISCPIKYGDHYFFTKNDGLQNQDVLYIQKSLDAEAKVFLDPNKLDEKGLISLCSWKASQDGKLLSYSLCECGSDWRTIRIKSVPSGEDLEDKLEFVKFSGISWTHDNNGFFYCRFPNEKGKSDGTENTQPLNHSVYYHRVGTSQSEDVLISRFPENPRWLLNANVSNCGKILFVFPRQDTKNNEVYYAPIEYPIKSEFKLTPLVQKFEASYEFVANDERIVYLHTNRDAPNYKMIKIDLDHPEKSNWQDIIPHHEKDVLSHLACVNDDKLVTVYMRDVCDIIQIRELRSGSLILTPEISIGTIGGISGRRVSKEVFFSFVNFFTPGIIYRVDMEKNFEISVFKKIETKGFSPDDFVVEQVFYQSKDDVMVPMFIAHSKDFKKDGNSPCKLYGYGGFDISIQPCYSSSTMMWLKNFRGVYAIANIRGGGEYGQKWHDGGRLENKMNCFEDFINAGKYLIKEGYSHKDKLIIEGGSNGGLLVAASSNLAPDIFSCAICMVGVLDMTRFHMFGVGRMWRADYGDPDEKKDFENLMKYSPLHNIPKGVNKFPATLIITGDHDDRVSPLHSLKYAAELQHTLGKIVERPLLLRVECQVGHGANKPIQKRIEETSDIYSFIAQTLQLDFSD
ncbi:prolyl endopeptidase-like isoform X2 [Brevipalpus obovatus]